MTSPLDALIKIRDEANKAIREIEGSDEQGDASKIGQPNKRQDQAEKAGGNGVPIVAANAQGPSLQSHLEALTWRKGKKGQYIWRDESPVNLIDGLTGIAIPNGTIAMGDWKYVLYPKSVSRFPLEKKAK